MAQPLCHLPARPSWDQVVADVDPADQHKLIVDQGELAKIGRYRVAAEAYMDAAASCFGGSL